AVELMVVAGFEPTFWPGRQAGSPPPPSALWETDAPSASLRPRMRMEGQSSPLRQTEITHRSRLWEEGPFMYDAIVVGARCAGSPTAMLLARKGHKVLLLDRYAFPSDTMRNHFIQLPGVLQLKRWGLLDD